MNAANIESFFINHTLSELKSPIGLLRRRAIWLYSEFGDFNFQDEAHIAQIIDGIY